LRRESDHRWGWIGNYTDQSDRVSNLEESMLMADSYMPQAGEPGSYKKRISKS